MRLAACRAARQPVVPEPLALAAANVYTILGMIETGTAAPDFELANQDGEPVKLSGLRGKPVVLYFYPKADTPGCTTQACGVRDHRAGL